MNTEIKNSDTILDRAVKVMDFIAAQPEPPTFSEILSQVGFNRATLAKILRILCTHDMLEKAKGGYAVGTRPSLYASNKVRKNLIARCRPYMESLSSEFGVTVILIRVTPEYSVCLHKVMDEHAPAMRAVGSVMPEKTITPWALLTARAKPEFDLDKAIENLLQDAGKTRYVPRLPTRDEAQTMLELAADGSGDDLGLFIPNVRRLAVRIDSAAEAESRLFIAAGLFGNPETDVAALAEAMQNASQELTQE